jgi:hypothetical protein
LRPSCRDKTPEPPPSPRNADGSISSALPNSRPR